MFSRKSIGYQLETLRYVTEDKLQRSRFYEIKNGERLKKICVAVK